MSAGGKTIENIVGGRGVSAQIKEMAHSGARQPGRRIVYAFKNEGMESVVRGFVIERQAFVNQQRQTIRLGDSGGVSERVVRLSPPIPSFLDRGDAGEFGLPHDIVFFQLAAELRAESFGELFLVVFDDDLDEKAGSHG